MLGNGLGRDLVQRGDFRLRQPKLPAEFAQNELRCAVLGGVENKCVAGHNVLSGLLRRAWFQAA